MKNIVEQTIVVHKRGVEFTIDYIFWQREQRVSVIDRSQFVFGSHKVKNSQRGSIHAGPLKPPEMDCDSLHTCSHGFITIYRNSFDGKGIAPSGFYLHYSPWCGLNGIAS